MFNEEIMDKIMKKCQEDPNFLKLFQEFMMLAQKAAQSGMSVNEMANICMLGYTIGEDPALSEMVLNMAKISEMGLDIIDK